MDFFHRSQIWKAPVFSIFLSGFLLTSCDDQAPVEDKSVLMGGTNANIITSCKQTVFDYAHSRDAVDLEANVALFTPSAKLSIGDNVHEGRKEILSALAARGPKEFTRHVIASVSVSIDDNGGVTGKSYALVYAAPPRENKNEPVVTAIISPKVILTYNDIFDVTGNLCLISKRTINLDMVAKNEQ